MSTFQDFGPLSERRRIERQQARNKKIMFVGGTISFIVIVAVVAVGAIVYSNPPKSSHKPTTHLHSNLKALKFICSPTSYPKTCQSRLAKHSNATSTTKDLIKAAISSVAEEITAAVRRTDLLINSDDPQVKGAVDDCKELLKFAEDELARTLRLIDVHKLEKLPTVVHELKNWLSAVISYQDTCVDGFPEGELKTKMKKGLRVSKELTSNSLAIVSKLSTFLGYLHVPGFSRHLLAEEERHVDENGFPEWLSHGDRRVLASKATKNLKPNVTVAKDGSGEYKTINDALANMPKSCKGRYVIYVKAGVYDETVLVTSKMVNVTIYGDGSQKSIVTGNKNFVDGTRTFQTASFAAVGDGFMAVAMGFRNTAGAIKHQAVALRVQSDRAVFLNCRIEGYQDTLYAQTHRQFYRSCIISGTIDFIFGDAAVVLQNCILILRRPLENQQNIVTAQGRTDGHESTGIVLHKCKIIADKDLVPVQDQVKSYLGRPWKQYSRTVIMESIIPDFIQKDGYLPWDGNFALKTLFYAEYQNIGADAHTKDRVKWPGVKVLKNRNEALAFTAYGFLQGQKWIKSVGAPVRLTLYH